MLELRFHGSLGRDFGRVWNFEVGTVREAINALCALKPGFRRAILLLDQAGLVFKVRTKEEDLGEEHLEINLGDTRVDVVPIMRGAGAAGRIIAGVVLIAAGFVYGYVTSDWVDADHIAMLGLTLVIGGVVELLSPHPKKEQFKDDIKSWTINGPLNTVDQGNPVPVIYGEVLTGGVPISAGLTTSRAASYDSVVASVDIGGDFDSVMRFGAPVSAGKIKLRFSASGHNVANLTTYTWSFTGFASATTALITSGNGTATIEMTVTYNIPTVTQVTDSFTVTCLVHGGSSTQYDSANNRPAAISATGSNSGTVVLDTRST